MHLLHCFALLILALTTLPARAALSDEELVATLLTALRPVADSRRQENVGAALRVFKAHGLIQFHPQRLDYTDFYPLQKPMSVFGHDLIWLEEEYTVRFIGCCVNEGGTFLPSERRARVTPNP